jgi:DNA-binding beta-propeller fold protein YncE
MIIIISSSAQSSDYPVPIIFKGQTPTLDVRVLGSYQSGFFSNVAPETPPAYDPTTRRIYVFSPIRAAVEILSIDDPSNPIKIAEITDPSGQLGIPSSLAFDRGLLAVALEDPDDTQRGRVVFGDADGNIISPPIEVGIQPEMLAFTPDGRKIVVINKGNAVRYTPEPIDPEASVSIITLRGRGGQSFSPLAETITFERFNGQLDLLRHAGVRIYGPGASVAQDLEPDSVTVSQDSQKAWITLNRNNALAEVVKRTPRACLGRLPKIQSWARQVSFARMCGTGWAKSRRETRSTSV